ncbi:histidine kinase [Xanthobacter sp. TB0139]|uniref:histidine kinase n=1 Tax=Xanthobacter sp. TB0139 TaxID=3459178 RepID=UPI00403A2B4F
MQDVSNTTNSRRLSLHFFALLGLFRLPDVRVRLLSCLLCICISILLLFLSALVMRDYERMNQAASDRVQRVEYYWADLIHLVQAEAVDLTRLPEGAGRIRLNPNDREWLWLVQHGFTDLGPAFQAIVHTERIFRDIAPEPLSRSGWLYHAQKMLAHHVEIQNILMRELKNIQRIVQIFQVFILATLVCCLVKLAGDIQSLFGRLEQILSALPGGMKPGLLSASADIDGVTRLEQAVPALVARFEKHTAEAAWSHRARQQIRHIVDAQVFFLRFVELINEHPLNEPMLRKMLHALESALNVQNAAIIYTQEKPPTSSGRSIYSSYAPVVLSDTLFSELHLSGHSLHIGPNAEGRETRCVAVAFVEPSGEKAALLVEVEMPRQLEHGDMRVLEIAAGLLSITSKFQNHDQEGRRIAILEERAAIARELHDSIAQSLSFMKIQLARVQSSTNITAESSQIMIRDLRTGLDAAYRELRELLTTFRVHMDGRGLAHAIDAAILEFSQRSNLEITFENRLENCHLTVNEEFHILQVVRESLSNIVNHAAARTAFIELTQLASGAVVVTIDDDGVGCSPVRESYGHHGQAIMKERAGSLGGTIKVTPKRHGGTRVRLLFTPQSAQ